MLKTSATLNSLHRICDFSKLVDENDEGKTNEILGSLEILEIKNRQTKADIWGKHGKVLQTNDAKQC